MDKVVSKQTECQQQQCGQQVPGSHRSVVMVFAFLVYSPTYSACGHTYMLLTSYGSLADPVNVRFTAAIVEQLKE